MNRKLSILIALTALTVAATAHADDAQRTLKATIPASALHEVALAAGVGEVRIEPSSDGAVHVAVTLKPSEHGFWFIKWSGGSGDIAKAKLDKTVKDGVLNLSVTPTQDGDDSDGFQQEWQIQMPATLALNANVKVGDVRIDGIAGGVTAETKVGQMRIHVPKGSVKARVKVGELDVTTGATAYKDMTLDSSIGDVNIHGIDVPDAAHEQSGISKHVSLHGHGTDDFDLSCDIGEVNLSFGEQP